MPGYIDDLEEATLRRQYRRRRILAGIQGWVRLNSSPRRKVGGILILCAVVAATIHWLLPHLGLQPAPLVTGCCVLSSWPLFMLLFLRLADREYRRFDLRGRAAYFRSIAEAAEEMESRPLDPKVEEAFKQGISAGLRGSQGAAVIVMIFLTLVTLGGWLIWNLLCSSAALLATTILDRFVLNDEPGLFRKIQWQNDTPNLLAATGFHFVALALVATLLSAFLGAVPFPFRQ